MKTLTIYYNDLLERCMMESAYISRDLAAEESDSTRGTSRERVYADQYIGPFRRMRIRHSDYELIKTYIREGAQLAEARVNPWVTIKPTYTTNTLTWEIGEEWADPREEDMPQEPAENIASLTEHLLCAYVMSRWFRGKIPSAADWFLTAWSDFVSSLRQNLSSLRKPKKQNYIRP